MKTQKTTHLPMFASFKGFDTPSATQPKGYFVNRRCTQTGNKKHNFVWILTILMFTGLFGMASMSLAAEGSWTKKADMPTTRVGLSTSVVNGIIYAIGGGGGTRFFRPSKPTIQRRIVGRRRRICQQQERISTPAW